MMTKRDWLYFCPDCPGIRQLLGNRDAEIMEVFWSRPPEESVTVRDIFEVLHDRRRLAYTTIMSTMNRLAKKYALRVETQGQAYR